MLATNRSPRPAVEVVAEQRKVQDDTQRARLLQEYGSLLIGIPRSPIGQFLSKQIPGRPSTFKEVLQALSRSFGDMHWVDMGAGQAIAQREVNRMGHALGRIATTAVDLFPWSGIPINDVLSDQLSAKLGSDILDEAYQPALMVGDVQSVRLEQPAHLITSVMCVMYLDNPLQAVANWYNQLADGGFLLIRGDNSWTTQIGQANKENGMVMSQFVEHLQAEGIPCTTDNIAQDGVFAGLAIRRTPGTSLQVAADVIDARRYTNGYTQVTYSAADRPLEVVRG